LFLSHNFLTPKATADINKYIIPLPIGVTGGGGGGGAYIFVATTKKAINKITLKYLFAI